jgi:hypothetical protein
MANQQSRALTKKRAYAGEAEARQLVDFLNSNDPEEREGRERVQKVMKGFYEVLRLRRKYPVSKWEKYSAPWPAQVIGMPRKPTKLAEAEGLLNDELYRYHMNPIVDSEGWPDWGLVISDDITEWPMGESAAIETIVKLSQGRLLPRVQQCRAGCGTWFYKRFPQQLFCSQACKDKVRRSKPGYKKYWREYMRHKMRELRKGDKERQQRGLELVKKERTKVK